MLSPMSDPVTRLNAALEGRYAIERELGEGGMATVYLADDLKHERKVALKVLKPELAAVVGAERFLAEIKVTANLTHPHILPLHDSGEADGFLFYVMPYVEGETLRDRIDREKQLPVDEAVALASKVAGALQHAHEHAVIHRDIKPGNILLQDGEPVVSDFGIALAVGAAGSNRLTETGLSLGTPYYMSPEQATGDQHVGPSTDTYALGAVLYEMLTGDPPYMGSTAQAVLGQIIAGEAVSATKKRASVPANVDAALRCALEKLPADRFTSARDFAKALGDEHFRYGGLATAGANAAAGPWNRHTIGFAITTLMFALALAWGQFRPSAISVPGVPTQAQVTGLEISVEGDGLAISPDGRWIVAVGLDGSTRSLYIRPSEDPEWTPLPNTDGGGNPAFSPDGQSVAFVAGGTIFSVPIIGGPARRLATGNGPHWGFNDTIVYHVSGALYRVAAAGGEPELVLRSDTVSAYRPHFLPNGKGVVFGTARRSLDSRVLLFEIETGEVRELVPSGNHPRYVPTGHLIYGHGDGALMGVPFDLETLQTTGSQVTLLQELTVFSAGASQFSVSETGTLIYERGGATVEGGLRLLVEVDLQGAETALPLIGAGQLDVPRYSPNGSKIAYEDGSEIRIYDVVTGNAPAFTFGGGLYLYPVWSSDGEYLYFSSGGGLGDGYRRPADGREEATQLYDRPGGNYVRDVSPGDSIVVVRENATGRGRDLLLMRPRGDGWDFEDFLTAAWDEGNAEISPDGRWIAYQSNESGEPRIYVHSFPVITGRHGVSPGLGTDPIWRPDGRTLYYRSGSQFLAVEVTTEPGFAVSAARLLFDEPRYMREQNVGWVRNWDVHPDGSRFIMVATQGGGGGGLTEVYLVVNWFEELRERMGSN